MTCQDIIRITVLKQKYLRKQRNGISDTQLREPSINNGDL